MSGKRVLVALFFLFLIPLIFPLVNAASNGVNIALYHLTPKQELCRCEAFNYNFIVYNTGSFNETYGFSVSRFTHNFNISPSMITLEPRETANIGIGARLPCSVTEPKIDFIARTKNTRLKLKTPLQLSVNSSCLAPEVNITKVMPKGVKALSALLIFLTILIVMALLIMLILQKRPKKEYWWSSYFRIRPERKTTIIEVVTIIIVVFFLILLGLRGFQQIGRNETLITTYIGPRNVTQPITKPMTNISMRPVVEKVGGVVGECVHVLSRAKQFLWPYKVYILIGLILLILIILMIIMSIMIIKKRKIKVKTEKIKKIKVRRMLRIRWRYILIPTIIILVLLALVAASSFLVYKYRSEIRPFLSQVITKLKLSKVKNFLLPKLSTVLNFVSDAFDFVRPYLLYVVIGIVLLVIIILILRRREKRVAKVVTVIEKRTKKRIPKKRRKKRKKKAKKKR